MLSGGDFWKNRGNQQLVNFGILATPNLSSVSNLFILPNYGMNNYSLCLNNHIYQLIYQSKINLIGDS